MSFQALRTVALQLEPGSDVRLSLEQLGREQGADGFVLSVVGNLSKAAFQCPGQPQPTLLGGVLEIITLQGTVGPRGVHLHLSLSDSHCQVWGGHLEPGALVHSVCELLVGFLAPAQTAASGARTVQPLPADRPRVEVAVQPGCPWSTRALRLLRTLGIPYVLVDPRPGISAPQVAIDGVAIGGYDALAELHGRGELQGLRQS